MQGMIFKSLFACLFSLDWFPTAQIYVLAFNVDFVPIKAIAKIVAVFIILLL